MAALLTDTIVARSEDSAADYLAHVMDQYHSGYDVYTDAGAAGNHFVYLARMSSHDSAGNHEDAEQFVPPMDLEYAVNPHAGATCIKATFTPAQDLSGHWNWGAWYFMNGAQRSEVAVPEENWGSFPNAGIDLTGATELSFWARGEKGGERVEFFALGVGWNADMKRQAGIDNVLIDPATRAPFAHPDSSPKVSSGYLMLLPQWREYTLHLRGANMHYVLGGFGWAASAAANERHRITFYVDDIRYAKRRLDEPRFLVSYESTSNTDFDKVQRNAAHVYDNALALLAFLAVGDQRRAGLIADAFIVVQQHDRAYTPGTPFYGAVRNVYQGGDLLAFPGWPPDKTSRTARMSGWYDTRRQKWLEDSYNVSFRTGNVAWVMLALIGYHEATIKAGNAKYLKAAEEMGEWVERHCYDAGDTGGYTLGFDGWEPNPLPRREKATEHNIDLYAAFMRLYKLTNDEVWLKRANHAKQFVAAMWDETEGKFWTGTDGHGAKNKAVIPVDVQAWALLALRGEEKKYERALNYAEHNLSVGDGFDFNQDRDGIWYEGTAHMAVAYLHAGRTADSKKRLRVIKDSQLPSGALPAASKDGLTTGFDLEKVDGEEAKPWLYYKRPHVGATAWLVFAETGVNPFWMEKKH
jgi:hypothetical protein